MGVCEGVAWAYVRAWRVNKARLGAWGGCHSEGCAPGNPACQQTIIFSSCEGRISGAFATCYHYFYTTSREGDIFSLFIQRKS